MNPGTRRIMDISLSSVLDKNYREAFGISDISEVSFTLEIKNADYEELIAPREIEVTLSDKESAFDASGEEVYNENDIRIVSKGVFKDSSEDSEDIKDAEITFEIKDKNYNTIAEPKVSVEY